MKAGRRETCLLDIPLLLKKGGGRGKKKGPEVRECTPCRQFLVSLRGGKEEARFRPDFFKMAAEKGGGKGRRREEEDKQQQNLL